MKRHEPRKHGRQAKVDRDGFGQLHLVQVHPRYDGGQQFAARGEKKDGVVKGARAVVPHDPGR